MLDINIVSIKNTIRSCVTISPVEKDLLNLWNSYSGTTTYLLGGRNAPGLLLRSLADEFNLGIYNELSCAVSSRSYRFDGVLYSKRHADDPPVLDYNFDTYDHVRRNVVITLEVEGVGHSSDEEIQKFVECGQPCNILLTWPSPNGWVHRGDQCLDRYRNMIRDHRLLNGPLVVQSPNPQYIVIFCTKVGPRLQWDFYRYDKHVSTFLRIS